MYPNHIARILTVIVFGMFATNLLAEGSVQSSFIGPVKAKVWQHWQQSWNVENITKDDEVDFRLERGLENGKPYVKLFYRNSQDGLAANLTCESYVPEGQWNVKLTPGNKLSVNSTKTNGGVQFDFAAAEECVDSKLKRIVTKIQFSVLAGDKTVFEYTVLPMYVRGKEQSYWQNPIPAYSAHAGSGEITVSNSMTAETGWDRWGDTLVMPILNFVDRNTMKAGSEIGLHRHVANQEVYFIENGQAEMLMGVTNPNSPIYKADRKWSEEGEVKSVDEFYAQGGWFERRVIRSGEVSVIVPKPNDSATIYFHGIRAIDDTVFWTMGSKN